MAEYIERESLMQKIGKMIDYCEKDNKVNGLTALFQVGDAIMDCKSEDVAPVRHGRWIMHKPFERNNCNECIECSDCNTWFGHDCYAKTNYCPSCGTKMDLGGDDNG